MGSPYAGSQGIEDVCVLNVIFIIVIIAENIARVEWRFIGIILRGVNGDVMQFAL
jgi:hypothetical protein